MNALVLCTLALASLAAARPQFNQYQQQQVQQVQQQQVQQQQVQQQQQRQYYQQPQQFAQQQFAQQPQQFIQPQQQFVQPQQQFAYRDDASSTTTPIPIISYVNEQSPDGSYHYSYETGNGIKADESGKINNPGLENEALAVQGSYSYIGDDGQTYSVQYIADENGFQPQGAHLPTPPPIPAELQKAIDEHLAALATAAPAEEEQQGSTPDQRYFPQRHF